MRYCHYCRLDTETVDEDCVECGLSKPYDVKEADMTRKPAMELDAHEYSMGCVDSLDDDDYEEELDDEEYEEGSYYRDVFKDDPIDMFCDEFEEE